MWVNFEGEVQKTKLLTLLVISGKESCLSLREPADNEEPEGCIGCTRANDDLADNHLSAADVGYDRHW